MEINKDLIERLYTQEGKTCEEIGLIVGLTASAICYRMKRYGIKGRKYVPTRLGAKVSKEIKEKISKAHMGKTLSPEHRDKVVKTLRNGKGQDNPHWKGGRTRSHRGYVLIRDAESTTSMSNGYVFEHRLVVESHIGRKLSPSEHIHHINGDKQDNRIENLLVVSPQEHSKIHWSSDESKKAQSDMMKTARSKKFWSTKRRQKTE